MSATKQPTNVGISSFEEASPPHLTNLTAAILFETAVRRNEGSVAADGPLVVKTGEHTGRSAQDKFIVRDDETDQAVWWDANMSITSDQFGKLHEDMLEYAGQRELFSQDLRGGADMDHHVKVRVFTEYAWHGLFIQHLLIRPAMDERNVDCLLYTSPSPRDQRGSRMPSSA